MVIGLGLGLTTTRYFILEIPSNLVIRKFGAARWLAFLSFAWGVCILGGAFAKHWGVIVVVRALVGAFEAGFFPGCMFLITVWYVHLRLLSFCATSFCDISFFFSVEVRCQSNEADTL